MEIIIDQDHISRLLTHICPVLSHGYADVRLLQGHSVVHPVARHADYVATALQGLDYLQFVAWRYAVEYAHVVGYLVQLVLVHLIHFLTGKRLVMDCIDTDEIR